MNHTTPCPTPRKEPRSKAQAKRMALRLSRPKRNDTRYPYKCECGKWHLSGMPTREFPHGVPDPVERMRRERDHQHDDPS